MAKTLLSSYFDLVSFFDSKYSHFDDGRIDYSGVDAAAVVTVFVRFNGRILIVKRSQDVSTYRGLWNGVAGYLDDLKATLEMKVLEELAQELSLKASCVESITYGKHFAAADEGVLWHVFPCIVDVNTDEIALDYEATEFAWILPEEYINFDCVPALKHDLVACGLISNSS